MATPKNCGQDKTLVRMTSVLMSSPETLSDSFSQNVLVLQTSCCTSCQGGQSQTISLVNKPDVEVLGWRVYMSSGHLHVLPNSWKWHLRWLMVVKRTFNSQGTSTVNICVVNITIARSLKTSNICGILSGLYHHQSKAHLCSKNCCLISMLICHTCQMEGLSWQREVLSNMDLTMWKESEGNRPFVCTENVFYFHSWKCWSVQVM